jgi:hypothetical protein
MAILRWLLAALGIGATATSVSVASTPMPAPDQAVIVQFEYGSKDWSPFFDFEKELNTAIANAGVGEYDGNELAVDGSDGSLYFYGPDADKLFAVVKAQLSKAKFMKKIRVTVRYGSVNDKNVRETHVEVTS